jgi:O-antigen/teichoic acid export membrane protein
LRDSAFIAISQVLGSFALIAVQIFLARSLALAEFGEISLSLALLNTIESIFVARSTEVTLNLVGKSWKVNFSAAKAYEEIQRRHEFYWGLYSFSLLVGLAIFFKSILNINIFYLALMTLCIPFQAGFGVSKAIFIVSGELKKLSLLEIINSIFSVIVFLILIFKFGAIGFVLGVPVVALFKNILISHFANKLWPSNALADKNVKSAYPHLSFHSILRNIFLNISSQADIILLGFLGARESVAIYKVAKTLANIPSRIASPIWAALRPKMLDAVRPGNQRSFRKLFLYPASVFLFLLIPLFALSFFIFQPFVQHAYGKDYLQAFYPFLVLFLGSWIYNAVSGWMSFMVIISPYKKIMTGFMGCFAISVVLVSTIFYGNLIHFACAISLVSTMMSLICWAILFWHKYEARQLN